jgi:hypothetical protein
MMSIFTLVVMIILVATMRPIGGKHSAGTSSRSGKRPRTGDTLIVGRGVKLGPPQRDPNDPGKVTYELMKNNKLPSPAQRALRRFTRPLGRVSLWVNRRFRKPKLEDSTRKSRRSSGESVELQNFLEARNREIARRKSEDPSKRGPEDTLH